MTRRRLPTAVAGLIWLLSGSAVAQGAATVGAAVSAIRYDGFLGSAAAVLSPALRYDRPRQSLAAQGDLILFESGNAVLQGSAAGVWLSPAVGKLRGELGGVAGASAYAAEPTAGHILGRARAHLMGVARGVWVGGALGRSYVGGTPYPGSELGLGVWLVAGGLGFTATVTRTHAVDSTFVDLRGAARWTRAALELTGNAGARTATPGSATTLYGELTARVSVTRTIALVVSGGRFPGEPLRRTLGGRHVTAGLEVSLLARPTAPAPLVEALGRRRDRPDPGTATRLSVVAGPGDTRTLRVQAPGARSVELMGDFTDWQPVALRPLEDGMWELTLELTPGVYRVNVRLGGGPWLVPLGTRGEEGDFGEPVGVVVVW